MTPDSERRSTTPTRPSYLLAALVAMWVVGLNTAQESYGLIQLLRDPLTQNFVGDEAARDALIRALSSHVKLELPIHVAHLLLGGLLVFVATNIFLGGRPSIPFTLQVLVVNLALLIGSYVLREPTRAAYVGALVESSETKELMYQAFVWRTRLVFALYALALGLCIVAFSRKATRDFLAFDPELRR